MIAAPPVARGFARAPVPTRAPRGVSMPGGQEDPEGIPAVAVAVGPGPRRGSLGLAVAADLAAATHGPRMMTRAAPSPRRRESLELTRGGPFIMSIRR